jgi:RNA polymerase sigma-70 factor (ECF subfamily)
MDGSDAELVARAKAGDDDAFRGLVELYGRKAFRLAYRLTGNEEDAEDVVQESFLKAYKSLPRFEGKSEFGSWLYRIVTNVAFDALRRRERRPTEPEAETPSGAPSPERAAEGSQIGRRLRTAMALLTPSERTAFVLRHFEGRPVAEIAETLGIRTGATKNCIFRAVAKLRSELAPLAVKS